MENFDFTKISQFGYNLLNALNAFGRFLGTPLKDSIFHTDITIPIPILNDFLEIAPLHWVLTLLPVIFVYSLVKWLKS